jgi:ribosome biogenesis protein MAK21
MCRPGQKSRAQYYAVVTLNQMVLSHKEARGGSALAAKLIDIYFTLFRLTIEHKIGHAAEREAHARAKHAAATASRRQKSRTARGCGAMQKGKRASKGREDDGGSVRAEEVDSRMLGALLTGVRRAFPYVAARDMDNVIERHSAQLFQTVYRAPFHVGTQALLLVFQVRSLTRHLCAVSMRSASLMFAPLFLQLHSQQMS